MDIQYWLVEQEKYMTYEDLTGADSSTNPLHTSLNDVLALDTQEQAARADGGDGADLAADDLQKQKIRHLIPLIDSTLETNDTDDLFNKFERFVLENAREKLSDNPFNPTQHIALRVLKTTAQGKHLSEKTLLSSAMRDAKDISKNSSDNQDTKFSDPNIDGYFAALKYMISDGVYEILYGDGGFMEALARRVIVLESDTILGIADRILPKNYVVNRAFISKMLEICASGAWPEWSAERFIDKIEKHLSHPYSDSEFRLASTLRVSQAQSITRKIFDTANGTIAVGYTGSVARDDCFGLHPYESDIDLLVYSFNGRSITRSLETLFEEFEKEEQVSLCLAGLSTDLMLMSQPITLISTPDEISGVIRTEQRDALFPEALHLASNHVHGVVSHVRYPSIYNPEIDQPLRAYYDKHALSCQMQIANQLSLIVE